MTRSRYLTFCAIFFSLLFLFTTACADATVDNSAAQAAADDAEAEEAAAAAALAAEEAAAAAVGEAAEDEEEDDADALDEDADSARPDFERRHPLTDMPPPATDIDIGHAFSTEISADEAAISTVTLGDPIKAVIGFRNLGRIQYHVWGVIGSLNMDNKFGIYVQNFTYGIVNKTVEAREELSFSYKFTPNERLDTRKFQLALSVFYEARGSSGNAIRGHSTTFFNNTIATQAGEQSISNAMFMVITTVLVGAGIGALLMLRNVEAKKAAQTETGTEDGSKNEWLEEHQKMARTGGGRARRKSSSSQN